YQVRLREDTGLSRNAVMDRLFEMGIPTRRGVMASHLEPPYRRDAPFLPLTESTAAATLQLPMHPELTPDQQDRVLNALDLVTAQFAVLVWRWQLVIHILGGTAVGFGPLALLLGHSFLIGQVLPSSVGGDVARTVLLSRSTGAAAAARSVICDRMMGFAALALLVVPSVPVIA